MRRHFLSPLFIVFICAATGERFLLDKCHTRHLMRHKYILSFHIGASASASLDDKPIAENKSVGNIARSRRRRHFSSAFSGVI